MSGDGEVWISPYHFFGIAATMRQAAVDPGDLPALTLPDVYHAGGSDYLAALITAAVNTRTNVARNIDIAGRAFVVAGTQTVTADLIEEGASHIAQLDTPYTWDPADDAETRAAYEEELGPYYDELNSYHEDYAPVEDD